MQRDLDRIQLLDIFNVTKKVETDLAKIQNVTSATVMMMINPFNLFNLTQLNMTNLDIFNLTKQVHQELDPIQLLPNVTTVVKPFDLFNVTQINVNVTNMDFLNVTKKIQNDWTNSNF